MRQNLGRRCLLRRYVNLLSFYLLCSSLIWIRRWFGYPRHGFCHGGSRMDVQLVATGGVKEKGIWTQWELLLLLQILLLHVVGIQ
ncbi:hypothetical protein V8C44DRAFT_190076 [Trichoderma aethiopicum]